MSQEEILELIEKISPQAKEYVSNSIQNVEVLYSINTLDNKGLFIKVDNEDCCIFYSYFLNEDSIEDVLELIKLKINEFLLKNKTKELCFNIWGNNSKIIDLVRSLGFKSDMEGYHLEYKDKNLLQLINCNLEERSFDNSKLKEFIDLFDSAYYQLNVDNDWDTNSYALDEKQFQDKLNTLVKHNQIYSFWLRDELVGAYIFQQNYITDLVVRPRYQNHGYGTYILAHCIRTIKTNKSIDKIRLRIAKSNSGAKKLYERNGFAEIACFAEHTYVYK
jgi:ribosomal protein S18 acetylase RimI-like enzyme